jgi:hypothetical protein
MATASEIVGFVGSLVSIVVGLFGIAVGALAIWLSLYFYRRSSELDSSSKSILSRIEASSHTTEVTQREVITPVVKVVTELLSRVGVALDEAGRKAVADTYSTVDDELKDIEPNVKERVKNKLAEDVANLERSVRKELGKMRMPEAESAGAPSPLTSTTERQPAIREFKLLSFVRYLAELERTHDFLSVKWLRQKKLASNRESVKYLQYALDNGILQVYPRDNPKNREFPTLCCRLDRTHPIVVAAFGSPSSQSRTAGGP